jgi:hypothetical protein
MCCIASRHVGQAHLSLARVSLGGLRSPPRCGPPGRTIQWDLRNAPARGPLSRSCWRVPEGPPLARTPTPRSGTRTDFAARLRDLHHVRAGHGRRRCTTRPASGAVCAGSNPAGGALSEYVSDKCRGNRWHTGPFDRVPTAFLPVIQLRTRMRTDTQAATRSTTSRTKLCPAKSSYCALPTTCRRYRACPQR